MPRLASPFDVLHNPLHPGPFETALCRRSNFQYPMKVVIVAFGHPDNVFSLCSNLAEKSELTLVYLLPGKRYQRGILNFEVGDEAYGLHTDQGYFERSFPESLVRFVGDKYRVWTLRVPSLKLGDFRNLRIYWSAINTLVKEGFDIIHYNGFSPFIALF